MAVLAPGLAKAYYDKILEIHFNRGSQGYEQFDASAFFGSGTMIYLSRRTKITSEKKKNSSTLNCVFPAIYLD
jgi:hypothetical protein